MTADQLPTRRPPGRGRGLDGPPCPERNDLDQGYHLRPPAQAMCVRCGRVTARRDTDGLAWCGGQLPDTSGGTT